MPDKQASGGNSAVSAPAPKFSLSLGASRSATPKTAATSKRPRALLGDDQDEAEGPKQEAISDFGSLSASNDAKKEPERVIKSLPNRDWQEDMRRKRQKSGIPQRSTAETDNTPEIVEASKSYGLTFRERSESPSETPQEQAPTAAQEAIPQKARTADDEALDALTGKDRTQDTIIRPQSPQNEDEAFRAQYAEAPEGATLEDYAATPVEGFGAAILRGYLAPGETLESHMEKGRSKDRKIERRPGLLGIGAKDSGLGVELGAWGGTRGGKKGKEEINYNPLARKNIKTGEMVTEEDLRKRLAEQDLTTNGSNGARDNNEQKEQRDADSPRSRDKEISRRSRYDDKREDSGSSRRNGRTDDRSAYRSSHRERSNSREGRHRRERNRYADEDRRDKDRARRHRDDEHQSSGRSRYEHHRRRDRSR